jgi:RNA polymerase sigma-70 factor (ECF subfamily)
MQTLAARLARGDEAAFAELYDACADRLLAYVTARVGSRERAMDVVQETFLRAVASRRRFAKVENPFAYIFQIARNEAKRSLARDPPQPSSKLIANEIFESNDSRTNRERAELAMAALNRIAPDDRELVELKVFAGLTFREIADVTDMPQGTVASRYRRALAELRPWLTKQFS